MKFNGIDFFPFPSVNSTALKLLEAKYKLRGVAIYVKLLQKIFSEEGYYFQISDDVILLFKQEIGVNDNIIPEVIDECIARGIFDREMYEKHKILTSDEIQKEYINAVRKRKNFEIKEEYRLHFATIFMKKAEEKQKTAEEMAKTAEELDKGKESKVNENIDNKVIEREESTSIVNKTAEPFHSQINKFKQETGKYVSDVKVLPVGIDMDLLIDKVKKSAFLMKAKNLTLKHCLKLYDKIISGCYDNDIKQVHSSNDNVVITHNYTEDELNSFFTNLDNLDI